ncbi:MAG: hypothetical protein AAFN74_20375, partial [Myxococcota bacterium]
VDESEATAALAQTEKMYLGGRLNEVALTRSTVRAELFAASPEAQPAGRPRDLARMTAADLSTFFRHNLTRDRLKIQLVGRVPDDFSWTPRRLGGTARQARNPPAPAAGQRIIIVDKPGTTRAVVGLGQWPVERVRVPCGRGLSTESLGYQRGFWWMRKHPDSVENAVVEMLALIPSRFAPTQGCAADRRAFRGDSNPTDAEPRSGPSEAPQASVIVVVTGQTAGLAAALSQRTGITNVSVVPYDRDDL